MDKYDPSTLTRHELAQLYRRIEDDQVEIAALRKTLATLRDAGDRMAEILAIKGYDADNSEAVKALRKAQGG